MDFTIVNTFSEVRVMKYIIQILKKCSKDERDLNPKLIK